VSSHRTTKHGVCYTLWLFAAGSVFILGAGGAIVACTLSATPILGDFDDSGCFLCDAGLTGDAPAALTAQQAAADSAMAYCTQLAKCSQITIGEDYGSLSVCVSRRTTENLNGIAAPGTGTTPETTEACALSYATLSCADFLNDIVTPACRPQVGTGANGAPCAFSGQCQSAFCQVASNSVCGTCQPEPASGSSCALYKCPAGLHCALAQWSLDSGRKQ